MAILCGKNYTLHLVGCPRTSEQLEDIPRPRAELGTHITAKFVQAFGILGTGIGAGVAKYKVIDSKLYKITKHTSCKSINVRMS